MGIPTGVDWLRTALLAAIGGAAACSGSSVAEDAEDSHDVLCTPAPAGAGGVEQGGFVRCEEGYLHRPTAEDCGPPLTLPPGKCDPALYPTTNHCIGDQDCTMHANGRCQNGLPSLGAPGGCFCTYTCRNDADCGPGLACLCYGAEGGYCTRATCTTDADCSGSLCAQSEVQCGTVLACLSPNDRCRSSNDCEGQPCVLDTTTGARSCSSVCGTGGIGRPFLVRGSPRLAEQVARTDWAARAPSPRLEGLDRHLREALAQAWARAGSMEHASIAAFARFSLELIALGAGPEPLEQAHAALADETRHARVCFALASAYAGRPIGPGRLDVTGALSDLSLEHSVLTAIQEGCIGETIAAAEAAEASRRASDPVIAAVLRDISQDEARHAALAWRFVAWALEHAPSQARERIACELERVAELRALPEPSDEQPAELAEHGFVVGRSRVALAAEVLREIIKPCARLLVPPAAPGAVRVSGVGLRSFRTS
jgi:hypothetical protein